ncbi:hypothetical protein JCM11251_004552 [Rhodosporidiobolus azoricus]
MSRSPSPTPPDYDDPDAQARLDQLEALLAGQLFGTPSSACEPSPASVLQARPVKRKKLTHDSEQRTEDSEAVANVRGTSEDGAAEVTAFRLFSTQRAPQTVVLREAKSPEPFVPDRRIRAVEDEPAEVVEARRLAIEQLAVEGKALLADSQLPPQDPSFHARLCSTRLIRPSSSSSTSSPSSLPALAYLNARLPRPLHALSPTSVPERPHDGLIAQPPFKKVYALVEAARRAAVKAAESRASAAVPAPVSKNQRKKLARMQAEAEAKGAGAGKEKDTEKAVEGGEQQNDDTAGLRIFTAVEEKRRRSKDPRPKMPKRHLVDAYEQQHLQRGHRLVLKMLPVLKADKVKMDAGMVEDVEAARSGKTKGGKRASKVRRERVKKRLGGAVGGAGKAAEVAQSTG